MMGGMTLTERRARKAEREAPRARIDAAQVATRAVVESGVCPCCGSPVKRNLSLTGWWQCSQYGSDGFRADSNRPQCGWQGFTQ